MLLLKKNHYRHENYKFHNDLCIVIHNKCSSITCPSFMNKSLEVKSSVPPTSTFFKRFVYLSMRKLKTN